MSLNTMPPQTGEGAPPRGSNLRRDALTLGVPFLADIGVAIGAVGFPLAALRFNASPVQLGLLGAVNSVAYVLICLTLGGISDRVGRRGAMFTGASLYALAFLVASHAATVPHLMAAAVLLGAAGGIFWPSIEGAVGDLYGHGSLGGGLMLFNVGWTLGLTAGALSGGWFFDRALHLPFQIGLGVMIASVLLLIGWPTAKAPAPEAHHAPQKTAPPEQVDYFLRLAWVGNFCCFFAIGIIRSLFPALARDLSFSGGLIGALIAVVSLAQVITFVPLARSTRWQYRMKPILAAEGMMVAVLLVAAFVSAPGLFALLFAILGAGCGVAYTASLFYSLNRPASRGKMGALHEAILSSGTMAGPLLGGALAQGLGLRAPYVLAAAVMAAGILLQARWHARAGK